MGCGSRLLRCARVYARGGGGGLKPPQDFKLMLLCVQTVTAKERKKQLSDYKQ